MVFIFTLFLTAFLSTSSPYNPEDVNTLSKIINAECGVCIDEEMYLVGSVVLNRSDLWGMTIQEVVSQESQFQGYGKPGFVVNPKTKRIAKELLSGYKRDYNVLYFYARDSPNKPFVKSMKPYICYKLKSHNYAG